MMENSSTNSLPTIASMWDFNDVESTRERFLRCSKREDVQLDAGYAAELQTQIARTYSLQGNYTEAHRILDAVTLMSGYTLPAAKVRYLLERGRTYRSSGEATRSLPYFGEAEALATDHELWRLAIDAVHMTAIAEHKAEDRIAHNLRGLKLVDEHPEQHGWKHALLNNLGEDYLSAHRYADAIATFSLLIDYQREHYGEADIYTIKDIAKAQRLNGNPEFSRQAMRDALATLNAKGLDDMWIREELELAERSIQENKLS
jgi:tetratricopeptide (TPR) repeat protein